MAGIALGNHQKVSKTEQGSSLEHLDAQDQSRSDIINDLRLTQQNLVNNDSSALKALKNTATEGKNSVSVGLNQAASNAADRQRQATRDRLASLGAAGAEYEAVTAELAATYATDSSLAIENEFEMQLDHDQEHEPDAEKQAQELEQEEQRRIREQQEELLIQQLTNSQLKTGSKQALWQAVEEQQVRPETTNNKNISSAQRIFAELKAFAAEAPNS